jgi:HPt (histidine-containing phosphotransfer) domain-containing protein
LLVRSEIGHFKNQKTGDGSEIMKNREENRAEPAWNQAELLERVDHDEELLEELLSIFKADFPRTIRSLEEAVARADLKSSAALSHALKGMLSNLGAARAAAAAAVLEKTASSTGETNALKDGLKALHRETDDLLPELNAYISEVRR